MREFILKCPRCGSDGEFREVEGTHETWFCSTTCQQEFSYCRACQTAWTSPMSPFCRDRHEPPTTYHPFIPYFDFALGKQIDSLAQRHREMRSAHVDYRDKPSKATLGERAERRQHEKQERDRGHAPGGDHRSSGRVFSR